MLKLAILDIDGVMTDGTKVYAKTGTCIAKKYCDCDFTAIKRLKAVGVKVCFLSGDKEINQAMAKNRNIDFYFARGRDKVEFLPELCKIYKATPKETLYVGDDIFDVELLKAVGYPFCPSDAIFDVKEVCSNRGILEVPAGNKVIASLYDHLVLRGTIKSADAADIKSLDLAESW